MFYSETGVEPSDCLLTAEGMAFLVPPGMVGRAVGKKGINVHKLRAKTNRNIYIFEGSGSEKEFIRKSLNVSSPMLQEAEKNNKKVIYVKLNTSDRYSMKRGAGIMFAKELFRRVFGKEMKIQSR